MLLQGRVINSGEVIAEAIVLDTSFSFIGDFDAATGCLTMPGHPLNGTEVAGKVLVIPTGKGGTIAPWVAYAAAKLGKAPAAILCRDFEPITCEAAITINIPMLVSFGEDITERIKTGEVLTIKGNRVESSGT